MADVAATHGGEGAVSALHAVSRVCKANRGADGRLERPPDATVLNAKMGVDATAAFVQYNCVDYYGDEADLADGLATLSDADLYTARVYSTNHARDYSDPTSRGDAVFPEHYAAALVGRSVAASNRHPAPGAWRPVRKPRLYDVLQAKRARVRADPNFLHAPPRLAAACGAPALRRPAAGGGRRRRRPGRPRLLLRRRHRRLRRRRLGGKRWTRWCAPARIEGSGRLSEEIATLT